MNTTTIPVLDELLNELEAITDHDIAVSLAGCPELDQKCTILGIVRSTEALRMEALTHKMSGKAAERYMHAQYHEASQDGKEAFHAECERYKSLAKLAGELFWAQTKDDLSIWKPRCVEARRNGTDLVIIESNHESHGMPEGLLGIIRRIRNQDDSE